MNASHWADFVATHVPQVYAALLVLSCAGVSGLWWLTQERVGLSRRREPLWSWWWAAVLSFGWWAVQVVQARTVVAFDQGLSQSLAVHANGGVLQGFAWVTRLADTQTLVVLGIVFGGILLWQRRWVWLAAWTAALVGNSVLNVSLKALFERVRPLHEHGYAVAHGWSFPSGHSSGAMAFWGMLAFLALRSLPRRWHVPVLCVATALIVTVGTSRVVLQVHFVSDVAAGFCSGFAWLMLCVMGVRAWERAGGGAAPTAR